MGFTGSGVPAGLQMACAGQDLGRRAARGPACPTWGGTQILSTELSGFRRPSAGRSGRHSVPPACANGCFAAALADSVMCLPSADPALAFSYLLLRTKTQKVVRRPPPPCGSSPTGPVLAFQQTFQDTRFQRGSPDTPRSCKPSGTQFVLGLPARSDSSRSPHWGPLWPALSWGSPQ